MHRLLANGTSEIQMGLASNNLNSHVYPSTQLRGEQSLLFAAVYVL